MRFAFLCCLLLSFACGLMQRTFAQPTFQSRYVLQQNTGGTGIWQFPNGGSIVAGNSQTDCGLKNRSCRYYLNANRVDNNGSLLWHKNYSTQYTYTTYETKGITTKDGGFAFLENLIDTGTILEHYHGGLLVKCNAKGDVEWSKRVVSKNYVHFEPYVLAQDNDGNLLLIYSVAKDMYASDIVQIAKVSGAGQLLWYNTIETTGAYYTYYVANSFRQIKNKYFIAGEYNNQYFEGLLSSNLLVLDTSGRVARFKDIDVNGLPSTLYNSEALEAFPNGNQLYLLGTYTNNESEIGSRYYLLPLTDTTTSANGTLLPYNNFALQHNLRNYKNAFPFSYYTSSFRKNGSLATLSYNGGYTYLKQYDSLGRICPDFALPSVDSQLLSKSFTVSDNTNYDILKDSVYLTDQKVFVSSDSISFELVCNGNSTVESDRQDVRLVKDYSVNQSFSVYPNPAHDVIRIGGLQAKVSVTILSVTGSVVKTASASPANPAIPVSGLANGVYFLRIYGQDKTSQIVTFLKE